MIGRAEVKTTLITFSYGRFCLVGTGWIVDNFFIACNVTVSVSPLLG